MWTPGPDLLLFCSEVETAQVERFLSLLFVKENSLWPYVTVNKLFPVQERNGFEYLVNEARQPCRRGFGQVQIVITVTKGEDTRSGRLENQLHFQTCAPTLMMDKLEDVGLYTCKSEHRTV